MSSFFILSIACIARFAFSRSGLASSFSIGRGEIVIVVGPPEDAPKASIDDADALLIDALKRLPAAKAASEVAKATGLQKRDLYARALELKE